MELKFDLKYGKYGLPIVRAEAGTKLLAQKHGNTFTIKGNRQGLLLLAYSLASLANMPELPGTEGYHIHLDDLFSLNDEGIEFILAKED
jgi:hypothetical protein